MEEHSDRKRVYRSQWNVWESEEVAAQMIAKNELEHRYEEVSGGKLSGQWK